MAWCITHPLAHEPRSTKLSFVHTLKPAAKSTETELELVLVFLSLSLGGGGDGGISWEVSIRTYDM